MKKIGNIVFTRNRPLQLEAYLRSLYRYFSQELIETHVVYKAERFGEEYEQVFRAFPDCLVIREQDLHAEIMGILERTQTEYILFGVDDTVFFDSVRFEVIEETFSRHRDDVFGFTLRFGPDSVAVRNDEVETLSAAGEPIYRLNWKKGQHAHSRYPFELGCTFYRTDLVRKILRQSMSSSRLAARWFGPSSALIRMLRPLGRARSTLKRFGYFFSPNTLESWPCRWCRQHQEGLPDYTYFQQACAVAIPVNLVNTSTENKHFGTDEHTVEALNEKYRQGYVVDIDHVAARRPTEPHGDRDLFRLRQSSHVEKTTAANH